jgi:hypothetical protein
MQEGPFSGIGIIPSHFLGVPMLNIDTIAKSLDLGSMTTCRDFQCNMVVGPFWLVIIMTVVNLCFGVLWAGHIQVHGKYCAR